MTAPETDVAATPARHVFISFASSDEDLAHRAVQSLERSGLRCWISDRDIEPAGSYPAAITSAVTESGAVLLLLTESSNRSPHVLREIELAFTSRRPILPVRVAGATPSSDLQYFLSTTQWLDAGSAFDEADLARVEPRLKELLQGRNAGGGRLTGGYSRPRIAAMAALVLAAVAVVVFWSRSRVEPSTPATDGLVDAQPGSVASDTAGAADGSTPGTGTAASGTATPGARARVNPPDGQTYVWVPPGRFTMGCSAGDPACEDDEKPVHVVEIRRGFWMARTEVTEQQYRKAAPAADAAGAPAIDGIPATAVTWAAAKAYCERVGGRLPTEAEWEYAARAGTSTRYYDSLPAIAWFADNSDGRARPVGAKIANAFGLHDMLGNVSEWVRDRYYNAYDDTSDDADVEEPLAGNASGVARGGSWVSEAPGVRLSRRLAMEPDAEEPHIGFRCAADRL